MVYEYGRTEINRSKNSTIDYYNLNAQDYSDSTVNADFCVVEDRFLSYLPAGSTFLDYGCGSGRDTKYFMDKGYQADIFHTILKTVFANS